MVDLEESFERLKGKRILYAEDNEINVIVAEKLLVKRGVVVENAENGKVAVEKLSANEYDPLLSQFLPEHLVPGAEILDGSLLFPVSDADQDDQEELPRM